MTIKILSLNIEGDKHLAEIQHLLQQEKPDVMCFQEIFEQDFHRWRKTTNAQGVFLPAVTINEGGNPGYHQRDHMGIALLSKLPGPCNGAYYFKRQGSRMPLYNGIPNSGHRALVWQSMKTSHKELTIATTHFTWSKGGKTTVKQQKDLRSLFKLLDQIRPDILCGDFNAPRGKEIYTALSEKFVDNIPKTIQSTIDPVLHYSHGAAQLVVDGFFTTRAYQPTEIKLVNGVSDHLVMIGTISI